MTSERHIEHAFNLAGEGYRRRMTHNARIKFDQIFANGRAQILAAYAFRTANQENRVAEIRAQLTERYQLDARAPRPVGAPPKSIPSPGLIDARARAREAAEFHMTLTKIRNETHRSAAQHIEKSLGVRVPVRQLERQR